MRSIQELTAAAAITDTSTTQISEFQNTQFAKDLHKYSEDIRILQEIVDQDVSLVGTKDKSKRIFYSTSHLAVTTTHTEGDERTYTEMTNLDSVDVTPSWDLGAIAISKELFETCSVDLVELAKYMIAQDAEKRVETTIITALETAKTNAEYGGDASLVGTLEPGDKISPDIVKRAKTLIRNLSGKPMFLIIHPDQEGDLLEYTQFTNADEYGGREVVLNGEIGKFVGLKVMVTENVNAKTIGADSWGADGHLNFVVGQNHIGQNAVSLVWKEKFTYSYEYLKRFANHYIYRDACYAAQLVQEKLVCEIAVTDA